MSGSPLTHPSLSGARPLGPVHTAGYSRAAAETQRAQSLLPRRVLEGCREAIQRITDAEPRSFGITSTVRGEGRSTVAAGMALIEWLDYERRTVIIDLDLERPSLHERFGVSEGPGIADLVNGHHAVEDHLQRVAGDVWLLSAGRLREDAPRTLVKLAQSSVISQLTEWADTVVFDLPPLLASSAGLEAARLCATPVLVVRAGVTPLPSVKQAADSLPNLPPVILNGARSSLPRWIRRAAGDWKP